MNRSVTITLSSLTMVVVLVGCAASTQPSQTLNNQMNTVQTNNTALQNSPANTTNASVNNNNNASNTSTTTTSNPSPSVQFDSTIAQAMQYVQQRSKFVLMAPTEPTFPPSFVKYIGAEASATTPSYSVNLLSTEQQFPINSPVLSFPPYTQAAQMIGSYGGTVYASEEAAKATLYEFNEGDIAPAYISPPSQQGSNVILGHGIIGISYGSPDSMVTWHEGDWTFQVWDTSLQQDVEEAKNIVTYLNTHLLPETYGVLGDNIAGDGNHTTAKWVYGNTVYSCFSYHSGVQAAEMAASMRMYPSGKIKP